jgi:hypothetical protein
MENLLNEKYHQSLAPTLRILESVCKKTEQEIVAVKRYSSQISPLSRLPQLFFVAPNQEVGRAARKKVLQP